MNREQYRKIFHAESEQKLAQASQHLSWLLTRHYTLESGLKLVGDRFRLNKTARHALKRAVCSDQSLQIRLQKQLVASDLHKQDIWIDGFNLLITVERALRGDPIICCRDGVMRDIAGVHGTYRKGRNTLHAFQLIEYGLKQLEVAHVHWLFDQPVSNSGKVAQTARTYGTAEVVADPDKVLIELDSDAIVISGDGVILEKSLRWFNLSSFLMKQMWPHYKTLPLSFSSDHYEEELWVLDLSDLHIQKYAD